MTHEHVVIIKYKDYFIIIVPVSKQGKIIDKESEGVLLTIVLKISRNSSMDKAFNFCITILAMNWG